MSIMTVIKKIGDKIVSIVEWPVKHSAMLVEFFADAKKDYPATKAVIVGLVQRFEALGPDVLEAIAAKGFDIPDDLKTYADLKGLVEYVRSTVLPTIETDYADFLKDEKQAVSALAPADVPALAAPEPAASVVSVQPGPGLHNVVPA